MCRPKAERHDVPGCLFMAQGTEGNEWVSQGLNWETATTDTVACTESSARDVVLINAPMLPRVITPPTSKVDRHWHSN